jgi:hypothetical protein
MRVFLFSILHTLSFLFTVGLVEALWRTAYSAVAKLYPSASLWPTFVGTSLVTLVVSTSRLLFLHLQTRNAALTK